MRCCGSPKRRPTCCLRSIRVTGRLQPVLACTSGSRGREVIVGDKGKVTVTMGRADENDVVIKGNLISRIHARVDAARNRFVLVDESTNGTFIQQDGKEEIYLRRDSAVLTGSGVISMGRVAARGTPLAIEYSVES